REVPAARRDLHDDRLARQRVQGLHQDVQGVAEDQAGGASGRRHPLGIRDGPARPADRESSRRRLRRPELREGKMAASARNLDSDGATTISAENWPDAFAGVTQTPKKFGVENTGTHKLGFPLTTGLEEAIVNVGTNDGAGELRIGLDTATLSQPWAMTAVVGPAGGPRRGTGAGHRARPVHELGDSAAGVLLGEQGHPRGDDGRRQPQDGHHETEGGLRPCRYWFRTSESGSSSTSPSTGSRTRT